MNGNSKYIKSYCNTCLFKMAHKKTWVILVILAAVIAYYATIPIPPDFSSTDRRTLRVIAFATDMVSSWWCIHVYVSMYNPYSIILVRRHF